MWNGHARDIAYQLVRPALDLSKRFTTDNIVFLWTNHARSDLKNNIIKLCNCTRSVIILERYRYNIMNINQIILEKNLNFF